MADIFLWRSLILQAEGPKFTIIWEKKKNPDYASAHMGFEIFVDRTGDGIQCLGEDVVEQAHENARVVSRQLAQVKVAQRTQQHLRRDKVVSSMYDIREQTRQFVHRTKQYQCTNIDITILSF